MEPNRGPFTGYVFYGLVYLGFALVSKGQYLWLLFGVYGVYNAATEGVEKALVAEIAPANQKATLLGLHATLVGIGLLPASIWFVKTTISSVA